MGFYIEEERKDCTACQRHKSSSNSSLSTNSSLKDSMKPWKSRSKSQGRIPLEPRCDWYPEGDGRWRNCQGRLVVLSEIPLSHVSENLRIYLQRFALCKLQELNLGCPLVIPKETLSAPQPKKRTMLLRRKAATAIFSDKTKGSNSHQPVFGVPLAQCITNEKSQMRPQAEGFQEHIHHCRELLSALRVSPGRSQNEMQASSSRIIQATSTFVYSDNDLQIPFVVTSCIRWLENNGLDTLGIFRVSGSQRRVRQLREDIDSRRIYPSSETVQLHDIAQLLKEFLRDLPEPLLTRALYKPFLTALEINDHHLKLKVVRWLLYLLPVSHRDTLFVLLRFLYKVAQHADGMIGRDGRRIPGNKMDANNLATVFGPNLLRMSDDDTPYALHSVQSAQERSDVILTISMLISNQEVLFKIPIDDLDNVYHMLIPEVPDLLNSILESLPYFKQRFAITEDIQHTCGYAGADRLRVDNSFPTTAIHKSFSSHNLVNVRNRSRLENEWNLKPRPFGFGKESDKREGSLEPIRPFHRMDETRRAYKSPANGFHPPPDHSSEEPFAATAAFTIKIAGQGTMCGAAIIPQNVRDTKSPSKSHCVSYGKVRHLTSPTYVTEEMTTTITVPPPPPPRSARMLKGDTGGNKPLNCNQLAVGETRRTNAVPEPSAMRPSAESRVRMRGRSVEQVPHHNLKIPVMFKREEIIASEHVMV